MAKQKWGEDMVKVVNMANMTMQAQAELVLNSAVLLVNQGGGYSVTFDLLTKLGNVRTPLHSRG